MKNNSLAFYIKATMIKAKKGRRIKGKAVKGVKRGDGGERGREEDVDEMMGSGRGGGGGARRLMDGVKKGKGRKRM